MRKHGAKIELGDNIKDVWNGIKSLFGFKDKDDDKKK